MSNHDSHERSHSRWMGWMLGLLAVPVLYVLTLPPISLTVYTLGVKGGTYNMPAWLEIYAAPYEWLARDTAMHGWLLVYGDWWASLFGIG